MALVVPNVGVLDGSAVQRGGVGDKGRGLMAGRMGDYCLDAEATAEQGRQVADERIVLHCFDGMIKICAACFQGCDFIEIALALAAAAMNVKNSLAGDAGAQGKKMN